jgi:PAS domain S-box-containing protein
MFPPGTTCSKLLIYRKPRLGCLPGQLNSHTLARSILELLVPPWSHPSQPVSENAISILESISDGFFALNENWEFSYVNRQAERQLGQARRALLGRSIWSVYPGLAGSTFEQLYRRVVQERTASAITAYYADHKRWYEAHAYPAERGISVYFRDVTGRVEAEEALRESEQRFRMLADSIPQIVWIVEASGKAVYFNRQWTTYTGVELSGTTTPQEVSDAHLHPDDAQATMEAWRKAAATGEIFHVEHRIRSATGEYRWFLVRGEPHRDSKTGEIVRWFGTSTDVHDRKLAESRLKKTEERYHSLLDSIDAGFCVIKLLFDVDGKPVDYRFVEINRAFERQTGLRNAVGKTMLELNAGHEAHWFEIYGRVAVTGESIRFVNEAKALDRWFDVFAYRVDAPEQHLVAVLFHDISDRIRNEEAMRQADQRKDEFLAMLAHELRNPLAPIAAAADLLKLGDLDAQRVAHTSDIISRQVEHMTGLVDDLLDVSRVTRGLVTLSKQRLDAKRVVADAVEQVRPLIESRGHRLAVHTPPSAAIVLGDAKRLVQVLSNLLNNAAKYTPPGGDITLGMEVEGDYVKVIVQDNGIGMTPELAERAFDMFAQAERTSDRAQGGLGIGLALVKSLVELHDGKVNAESEGVGKGSRFTLCLPRQIAPVERVPAATLPDAGDTNSSAALKVMVVDDNADAAHMLAMVVEAHGHQVKVEHHPHAALETARKEAPDVCLLDIGLPDMDGNELARRLRNQPETANAILVAVTGYGQEQDRNAALRAGFDHHFVKPVNSGALGGLLAGIAAK